MIKRFGFKNFSSFRDGAEISFELPSSLEDSHSIHSEIGSILGIKGANGSGKTNILKALAFLYSFCAKNMGTSKELSDGSKDIEIPLDSFYSNTDPTEFYIELAIGTTTYYYELDLNKNGIIREEIRRKKPKKEVVCIIRDKNKITDCLKEFNELRNLKIKSDQSIISLPIDYDFFKPMEDLEVLQSSFVRALFNVGYNGYRVQSFDDFFKVSEFYYTDNKAFNFTKAIITSIDQGITDIKIEKTIDSSNGETKFFPIFYHSFGDSDYPVGLSNESMGTKSLFLYLYRYWLTLSVGGLLVIDEFDTHLHSMILPELIELFDNKEINTEKAQLIFTAHNTEIIDALGRYKSILVNKEDNESYCYRLDEVSMLRNDRSISPFYMKGKIGGTPLKIKGLAKKAAKQLKGN